MEGTYVGLLSAIFFFGSISMHCASYFKQTSASLTITFVPILCLLAGFAMLAVTARRLLYPPDVGSKGSEVVDLDQEKREAVELVIQRDQFTDTQHHHDDS